MSTTAVDHAHQPHTTATKKGMTEAATATAAAGAGIVGRPLVPFFTQDGHETLAVQPGAAASLTLQQQHRQQHQPQEVLARSFVDGYFEEARPVRPPPQQQQQQQHLSHHHRRQQEQPRRPATDVLPRRSQHHYHHHHPVQQQQHDHGHTSMAAGRENHQERHGDSVLERALAGMQATSNLANSNHHALKGRHAPLQTQTQQRSSNTAAAQFSTGTAAAGGQGRGNGTVVYARKFVDGYFEEARPVEQQQRVQGEDKGRAALLSVLDVKDPGASSSTKQYQDKEQTIVGTGTDQKKDITHLVGRDLMPFFSDGTDSSYVGHAVPPPQPYRKQPPPQQLLHVAKQQQQPQKKKKKPNQRAQSSKVFGEARVTMSPDPDFVPMPLFLSRIILAAAKAMSFGVAGVPAAKNQTKGKEGPSRQASKCTRSARSSRGTSTSAPVIAAAAVAPISNSPQTDLAMPSKSTRSCGLKLLLRNSDGSLIASSPSKVKELGPHTPGLGTTPPPASRKFDDAAAAGGGARLLTPAAIFAAGQVSNVQGAGPAGKRKREATPPGETPVCEQWEKSGTCKWSKRRGGCKYLHKPRSSYSFSTFLSPPSSLGPPSTGATKGRRSNDVPEKDPSPGRSSDPSYDKRRKKQTKETALGSFDGRRSKSEAGCGFLHKGCRHPKALYIYEFNIIFNPDFHPIPKTQLASSTRLDPSTPPFSPIGQKSSK